MLRKVAVGLSGGNAHYAIRSEGSGLEMRCRSYNRYHDQEAVRHGTLIFPAGVSAGVSGEGEAASE